MNSNQNSTKTVYVGMSGGVDSSVSAALLKDAGYDVMGVYMKNWSGDDFGIQADCPWEQDVEGVKAVCEVLDIPFKSYNFEKEYREEVVNDFFAEYEAGRTPNPDILCNKEIKFKRFLERALEDGADFIATGHYAQHLEEHSEHKLVRGNDTNKDQTYFLHTFTQEQLKHVLFPIGHLPKSEVRKLADKYDLPNAKKKDSQGICFIGHIDVQEFLRTTIETQKGDIVDIETNEVVGTHDGTMFYTIGQRRGLGVGGAGLPYFVADKKKGENILYVAKGEDNPALFKSEVELEEMHWISGVQPELPLECEVQIRYRQKAVKATYSYKNKKHLVVFKDPVRAISPGQSAVLYNGDVCLGGGVIKSYDLE